MHCPGNKPEGAEVVLDVAAHDEREQVLHRAYLREVSNDTQAFPLTDADRYRWIRANRGSTMITDALQSADFDSDFDAQIDAAVKAHRMGRHLPLPLNPAQRVYGRRRTD